jgi:hypothetical protein
MTLNPLYQGRCKRGGRAFHVVLPPKRESLKQPTTTSSSASSSSAQNQQQSDVRVLLSLNSIFYSSWSRWSPCTKACTTTRYRYANHLRYVNSFTKTDGFLMCEIIEQNMPISSGLWQHGTSRGSLLLHGGH